MISPLPLQQRLCELSQLLKANLSGGSGLTEADDAVAGILWFRFNGVQKVTVGTRSIDWQARHLAHQEWSAQLNRFFFLAPLIRAYRQTGDAKYAVAARNYLEDWLDAHPVTEGKWELTKGDRLLDLAIRLGNAHHFYGWIAAIAAFAGQPSFDDAFVERLVQDIRAQLNYLVGNLTSLGNWRICEADCLVFASLLLRELPEAKVWQSVGVEALNEGFLKQVLPDGAHYELTPNYHNWMTVVFANYWRIGREYPELGLRISEDRLARMFHYALAATRPDGQVNAWNDSQSLANNSAMSGLWQDFCQQTGRADDRPTRAVFPWARQAAFRDEWTPETCYWTFEAAAGAGTHSHLSRNAFQLMAHGRPLLVDPGFLSYEASDPAMALGRSTRAHNTVNLNGWNQSFAPCSLFRHLGGESADLIIGQYDGGYWEGECDWRFSRGTGRGLEAQHHRLVLRLRDVGFLVVDQVVRQFHSVPETEIPVMEQNWQFATTKVAVDRETGVVCTQEESGNVLLSFPTRDSRTEVRRFCGESQPLRAWLPSQSGLTPAVQVSVSRPMPERYAEWVTWIVPFPGQSVPKSHCRVWRPDPDFISQAVIECGEGETHEITWSHRLLQPIGKCGEFTTDAPVVWIRRSAAGRQRVVLFGSEFASTQPFEVSENFNFWK